MKEVAIVQDSNSIWFTINLKKIFLTRETISMDRIFMHSGRFYFFSLSPKSKTAKIPSGFVFVSFLFAEEECFSDWSRQDLTAAINKRRTTNTTTNKYNTRYEAWGPIVDDDDDLVFWIMMKKTSTNVTYCTSTSTIMAWNASSIHTLIRLIFKSRSLSLSLIPELSWNDDHDQS